jgi:hypothetical protein
VAGVRGVWRADRAAGGDAAAVVMRPVIPRISDGRRRLPIGQSTTSAL